MLASGVPAPKSETVVSVKLKLGVAVVKLQLSAAPSALPAWSLTEPSTVTV